MQQSLHSIGHPQMLLIDLDGTLIDTAPDLALCVDLMMEALDMPVHGEEAVREWIGNGVERLVRRALIGAYEGEPEDELFQKAYPIFLELYEKNVCVRSKPYDGVVEGLQLLESMGIQMGCVTNKAARYTIPLLKALNLDKFFKIVVSGDTCEHKKPHPAPLLHAADFFGVTSEHALLIGDSINDVQAARAAGYHVVCVDYGYNHGQDIRLADPDVVISSLVELENILKKAA